jgi:hypothetical protein
MIATRVGVEELEPYRGFGDDDDGQDDQVKRYLVLANQTLGGAALLAEIRRRIESGPGSFYIVVPSQPDRPTAETRLDTALSLFRSRGLAVDGEVGDRHPVAAVHDALQDREIDEIIVSTLPAGLSRWIQNDTPSKIERVFGLPVTHVISTEP